MIAKLLASPNINLWISYWIALLLFGVMWYKGRLPTTGQVQDLTTVLNSRGGNILILMAASIYFFYHSEHMYLNVIQMIKDGTINADNGIALNGLTFDTGAFGGAFGALLKTMSPDAMSPPQSSSSTTTTHSVTTQQPPAAGGTATNTLTPSGNITTETSLTL
jgi:hypothetical protein